MSVEIRLFGILRQIIGKNSIQIQKPKNKSEKWTVGGLLSELAKQHPKLKKEIFSKDGESLNPIYRLLLNSKEITFKKPLTQSLNEGDVLQFFPPVSGG
jgi:MoaD family protein